MRHANLSKESIPTFPFVKSKPPLLTRSLRSLRAAARSTSSAIWLHHAHPFVAAAEKSLSHAEKQRVWSRSCGLQDLLQYCDCALSCAMRRTLVEIEFFATVGWKWGCQPFSCPCSQNVTHCRQETCSPCLLKTSILAVPFVKSKPPLPTRSLRLLRAAVRSTSSALWLHHAHPFVAAAEKSTCLMQRRKAFSHAVVVAKICYNTVIVLSVVL